MEAGRCSASSLRQFRARRGRAYPGAVDPLAGQRSFAAYGASHWAVLILLAVGAGVLAWFGTR